jgi:hypothetical protein
LDRRLVTSVPVQWMMRFGGRLAQSNQAGLPCLSVLHDFLLLLASLFPNGCNSSKIFLKHVHFYYNLQKG